MLVIAGKTASGKDTIVNRLISDYGYKKLITYTTRPMRNGESQDVTYHFISEEEFKNKIDTDFFAEWKSYDTTEGVWYYGSAKEDYDKADDETIIILTPDGYKDICKNLGYSPKCIYIMSDKNTIKRRLKYRGDNKKEAQRRIKNDDIDFRGFENVAHMVINNNFNYKIKDIVEEIGRGVKC